jgi:putative FmdB family regulatory protein
MPLYEYRCKKCGKTFEILQRLSDAPLTVHKQCGGSVEKLVSTSAFHFKGTGWYATDYAKSNPASKPTKHSDKPVETKPASSEPSPAPKS